MWIIFSLAFYIAIFMISAYPHIPEQFGGGRPRVVRLLIAKDQVASVAEIGLPIRSGKTRTEEVEMLYEGSDVFVIRLVDDRIIQLRRELVLGID
jgi:hypothetical protein